MAAVVAIAAIGGTTWLTTAQRPPRVRRSLPPHAHAFPRAVPRVPGAGVLRLPGVLPDRTVRLPILMYHRIDRQTPRLSQLTRTLTVTPAAFAAQMAWLVGHGFHAVTQKQAYNALITGHSLPSRPIMITFDDGYRDVYTYALPILRRLHLAATEYVITGRISGNDPSFLTWGELRQAQRQGLEIGSHTVTHRPLPALPLSDMKQELVASRRALEERLGHPVQWFAYPYGRLNAHTVAAVRGAGYVLAVTTQGGTQQAARHPLELHRYEIRGDERIADFAGIVTAR